MSRNCFQEALHHNFPGDWSESDQLVVFIFSLPLLRINIRVTKENPNSNMSSALVETNQVLENFKTK